MILRNFCLAVSVLLLAHCTAPISIRPVKPEPPAGALVNAADTEQRLAAIQNSYRKLGTGDPATLATYNYEIARLIQNLKPEGVDPWSAPLTLSGNSGIKTFKTTFPRDFKPSECTFYPADSLDFTGELSKSDAKVEGIGAPLVAVKSFEGIGHQQMRKEQPLRNFTAVVRFEKGSAILELVDPYQKETIAISGKTRTLAADYGAPVMLGLSKARIDKLGLARLLHPSRYNSTANLNFLQPYDPNRIPVLFVHGLDSTPATFAPMYFELLKDPEIRKKYQFWVFSYPSGYPYPYSASLLRRELDHVQSDFPGHKNMVVIGHSMGSLISRLMITNVGDKLWIKAFGHKPSETKFTGNSGKVLQDTLVFSKRKNIDRVVFYSGPHRGSVLASNWFGRLASRLVKMPGLVADVRNLALSAATADIAGLAMQSAPNSIGTLSPTNPFVVEINKIPIAPNIPYHSIMGDRGKGDTPNSSDGVVAYWSSHLDGAKSNKIVPSGHGSHGHPEGIAEAHRILLLHLK
jgi:pimeloyl-ACP methyl ester carboxylesterase